MNIEKKISFELINVKKSKIKFFFLLNFIINFLNFLLNEDERIYNIIKKNQIIDNNNN